MSASISLSATIEYQGTNIRLEIPSDQDQIGSYILQNGKFYELEFLERLSTLLSPDSYVVDVGANIGNHSLYFSRYCGCKVVSFEPVPSTVSLLNRNVRANFLDDHIEVRARALGRISGRASVTRYDPKNVGGTSLEMDEHGTIEVSTLDDEKFEGRVSLIKIDVEGMDLDVVRGGISMIAEHRPAIAIEVGTEHIRSEALQLLSDLGYTLAGEFNATPTLLFLPSRSEEELQKLLSYFGNALAGLQCAQEHSKKKIAQTGRYAERLAKQSTDAARSLVEEHVRSMGVGSVADTRKAENGLELRRQIEDHVQTAARKDDALHRMAQHLEELRATIAKLERRNGRETLGSVLESMRAGYERREQELREENARCRILVEEQTQALTEYQERVRVLENKSLTLRTSESRLSEIMRELELQVDSLSAQGLRDRDKIEQMVNQNRALKERLGHAEKLTLSLRRSSSMVIGRYITSCLKRPWRIIGLSIEFHRKMKIRKSSE